jgi:hypothetical protein
MKVSVNVYGVNIFHVVNDICTRIAHELHTT